MRGGTVNLNDTQPIAVDEQYGVAEHPVSAGTVVLETSSGGSLMGGPVSENVLREGDVVDRYRIVRLVAAGGMARVFEAVHVFTHKTVALKVMHQRYSERRDLIERFRHEAMALSSIHHENVVNVENAGLTDDGHVFIAMDLLAGKNLREVLQSRKSLGVIESLKLVDEVARGVAAAHAINIIHRDLKPENIFCQKAAGAKVLDLGTAKFAGDNAPTTQTAFGKVVGTAAYIAPERLEGEAGDERCDIYSLGLVLYECIAGHHPLTPDGKWPNAAEIASRQVTYQPRPIPGIPNPVASVIARSIHKCPDRRFRSMLEFSEAIQSAIDQLGAAQSSLVKRKSTGGVRIYWPIALGIVLGSGVSAIGFRLRHPPIEAHEIVTETVANVPAIQNPISQGESPVPAAQLPQPTMPPLSEAPAVVTPISASANGHSVAAAAVRLPKSNGKARTEPPEAPSNRARAVAKPENMPGVGVNSISQAGPVSRTGSSNPVKEDLPASGL